MKKFLSVALGIVVLFVIMGSLKLGFFVRTPNPESAIEAVEKFTKEVLLASETDKIKNHLHSDISVYVNDFEDLVNGFNLFGSPTELYVYSYQMLVAQQGKILVYVKGKNKTEVFNYAIELMKDSGDTYKVSGFARGKVMPEADNEHYKTPKIYEGKLHTAKEFQKSDVTQKRESVLYPFGNEPIKVTIDSSQTLALTAVAQLVLKKERELYLAFDFIDDGKPKSNGELDALIVKVWDTYVQEKAIGTGVNHVQIRIFFEQYEYGKGGHKFYAKVYDLEKSSGNWILRM